MPFKKRGFRPRRRRNYRRTRGPGRGYRPGVSRFGRISQPELKSKVVQLRGTIAAQAVEDMDIFPTISQGIGEDARIGNRVNAKFLNVKLVLTSRRQPDVSLPQSPPVLRWVMWRNKDPVTASNPTIAGLNLTAFLNTKQISIIRTGYITLSAAGTAKVKSLNLKMRNQVMDFKDQTDSSAATTQRVYLTVYSSQLVDYELQSKFYFADP